MGDDAPDVCPVCTQPYINRIELPAEHQRGESRGLDDINVREDFVSCGTLQTERPSQAQHQRAEQKIEVYVHRRGDLEKAND